MREAYSKEYWQQIDNPKPKRRVIEKVLDAIQLSLSQRRARRIFDKEFENLVKEQEIERR